MFPPSSTSTPGREGQGLFGFKPCEGCRDHPTCTSAAEPFTAPSKLFHLGYVQLPTARTYHKSNRMFHTWPREQIRHIQSRGDKVNVGFVPSPSQTCWHRHLLTTCLTTNITLCISVTLSSKFSPYLKENGQHSNVTHHSVTERTMRGETACL